MRAFLVLLAISSTASAGSIVPVGSLGAYHRDCAISDRALCQNDKWGSDTPGTIELVVRVKDPSWYTLYADQVDLGYFHTSYVDRGKLFTNDDHEGGEVTTEMYGARWSWEINSLEWRY